jgi:hybrid cluster-associated redox disulfide protein
MESGTRQAITADTQIEEMIRRYPSTIAVLEKYGLQCSECALINGATVAKGAERHHLNLKAVLRDLNKAAGTPPGKR